MHDHFFLIGAQRCGTTYLYHVLDEHPQIEMAVPMRPEPKFFLAADARDLADYQRTYFRNQSGVRLRGEKSTSYIEHERAAQQIAQAFPKAKILVALRNPIDRAVSNYWFSANNGIETASMETAFLHEDNRRDTYDHDRFSVSPFAYLKRGLYIDYLTLYEHYFPREQIIVLLFEQFTQFPDQVLPDLYRSLGVDSEFTPPSAHQRINESQSPDDHTLSAALKQYLETYFASANARLSDYLQIDLAKWGW